MQEGVTGTIEFPRFPIGRGVVFAHEAPAGIFGLFQSRIRKVVAVLLAQITEEEAATGDTRADMSLRIDENRAIKTLFDAARFLRRRGGVRQKRERENRLRVVVIRTFRHFVILRVDRVARLLRHAFPFLRAIFATDHARDLCRRL